MQFELCGIDTSSEEPIGAKTILKTGMAHQNEWCL